jgi:hypothetical protein
MIVRTVDHGPNPERPVRDCARQNWRNDRPADLPGRGEEMPKNVSAQRGRDGGPGVSDLAHGDVQSSTRYRGRRGNGGGQIPQRW